MKFYLLGFILLVCKYITIAQPHYISSIVVDSESREPLEFVDVITEQIITSTNSEGKFFLKSSGDSIGFSLLGYLPLRISAEEITDTLSLKSKPFQLTEVVVTNQNSLLRSVKNKVKDNYPFSANTRRYHIRAEGKKDMEIVKFFDAIADVSIQSYFSTKDNPRPKKNVNAIIYGYRKASKDLDVGLSLFSIEKLVDYSLAIFVDESNLNFDEKKFDNSDLIKLNFSPLGNQTYGMNGYYVIDNSDYSIQEFYLLDTLINTPYSKKGNIEFRTNHYELLVTFKKDLSENKYLIDKAKIQAKIEVIESERDPFEYWVEYIFDMVNFEIDKSSQQKISVKKDLFDLNLNYSKSFWDAELPILPLTRNQIDILSKGDPQKSNN